MTTEQKYKLYLHNKRREDLLRAFGVCIKCHKRDVIPGKTSCSICLAKKRAYDEQKRREKGIVPIWFKSPTICGRCRKEKPDNGCGLCSRCYDDAINALNKAHSCHNNKNHIWRSYDQLIFKTRKPDPEQRQQNIS